jgi:hypothetical protein
MRVLLKRRTAYWRITVGAEADRVAGVARRGVVDEEEEVTSWDRGLKKKLIAAGSSMRKWRMKGAAWESVGAIGDLL